MDNNENDNLGRELTEEEINRIRKENFMNNNRNGMAWAGLGLLILFLVGFGLIAFLFLFPSMYF